ncbi:MAG: aldo/keto reductase [Gemmatimonadaceae bacterium]
MQYIELGRTGIVVSRIAFGCAAIGGYDYGNADDDESAYAVRAALEAGITLFDTADVYGFGRAEEVLGRALASDRANVAIATKCGVRWDASGRTTRDSSPEYLTQAVDASLRRLGVEQITLAQLHWPDVNTPIEESIGALERCRERGKVRVIGCCNFPIELIDEAQRHGRLDSQQLPLSLGERAGASNVRECATRFGMGVLCYNTLAQGLFSGKFTPNATFANEDLRSRSALFAGRNRDDNFVLLERLRDVAVAEVGTTSQVAVRWVLDQPGVTCAIVGARSAHQVIENAGAARVVISAVAMQHLTHY